MRFRYSFQKIVDVKHSEKDHAEWVLSQAVGKLVREQQHLSQLSLQKDELKQYACEAAMTRTQVSDLLLIQHYVDHLDQQIEVKMEDVKVAKRVVATKQDLLQEKVREEKIWTKAREKAYEKFSAEMRLKEQNMLDEMATNRFKRDGT